MPFPLLFVTEVVDVVSFATTDVGVGKDGGGHGLDGGGKAKRAFAAAVAAVLVAAAVPPLVAVLEWTKRCRRWACSAKTVPRTAKICLSRAACADAAV